MAGIGTLHGHNFARGHVDTVNAVGIYRPCGEGLAANSYVYSASMSKQLHHAQHAKLPSNPPHGNSYGSIS